MKINIPKIQYYTTLRCNLRCELCGSYIPYYSNGTDTTLGVFIRDIDRLFELVNKIGRFELTGGEPLINPQIHEFLNHLVQFIDRIGIIRILTNGTLLPPNELKKAISRITNKTDKVEVLIDDYGPCLSTNVLRTAHEFEQCGAKVILRDYSSNAAYMGGWIDFELSATPKCTKAEFLERPEKCANYELKMHSLYNGVVYSCARAMYYYYVSQTECRSPDCVVLHDTAKSNEEIQNELDSYWNSEFYEPCLYCNGLLKSSKRFVSGIQLVK